MYARARQDGLGIVNLPIWAQIAIPVGATIGGAVATRLISGSGSPSQKDIEEQMKLQTQLDIQQMQAQQVQTESLMQYALPAAGVLALVMLLRR